MLTYAHKRTLTNFIRCLNILRVHLTHSQQKYSIHSAPYPRMNMMLKRPRHSNGGFKEHPRGDGEGHWGSRRGSFHPPKRGWTPAEKSQVEQGIIV